MDILLKLKDIDKRFLSVHALNQINLEVYQGETLALVGENGAGKSTLTKILTGAHIKDSGEIFFESKKVEIKSPVHAKKLGVSQAYQRAEIVPELTVAENIFLGEEGYFNRRLVSWKRFYEEAQRLLDSYEIDLDAKTPMRQLSVAACQLVAIVKILQRNPKLIIFDEPTAVLSDKEVDILFRIIEKLKKQKITIIYISHRLDEVFQVSDRIAVMRDGNLITVLKNENITHEDLISHMLGRKLDAMFPETKPTPGNEVSLRVEDLTNEKIHHISFSLHKGEILGIVGLVGSGRTELAKAIYGIDKVTAGKIYINEKPVSIRSPKDAIQHGIFLAPEDRKGEGIVPTRSIKENITYSKLRGFFHFGVIKNKEEQDHVAGLKNAIRIKAPTVDEPCSNLSGGNQQKVVVAKALTAKPDILIIDEPTQGIDVGAKAEIYELIHKMAQTGVAVLVISSEMEEAIGLCNRLLVMREGRLVGELTEELDDRAKILDYMYRSE